MKSDRSPDQNEPCGCGGAEPSPSRAGEGDAITRRTALKGAGAAVAAGATGAGGLLGAAAAVAQTHPKPPYDIRDQVQGSHLDSPAIQAVYDDINRMAILIGDIPFRRLFRAPLRDLVPQIESRIPQAHTYGLISDPVKAEQLAAAMVKRGPRVSIADIYVHPRSDFSNKALKLFVDLRRLGVRIPLPGGEKKEKKRAEVIRRLMKAAPFFTFLQYYTVAHEDLSTGTRNALAYARQNALLGWGNNDRCCAVEKFTKLDYCIARAGKFCALAPNPKPQEKNGVLYGFCVDASDRC
jgi:hypothetical protein